MSSFQVGSFIRVQKSSFPYDIEGIG